MDDVFAKALTQGSLDLFDTPKSWQPDLAEIRAELHQILTEAQNSGQICPWDERKLRYHCTVFPQMTRWLPDDEAAQLREAFATAVANFEHH